MLATFRYTNLTANDKIKVRQRWLPNRMMFYEVWYFSHKFQCPQKYEVTERGLNGAIRMAYVRSELNYKLNRIAEGKKNHDAH